MNLIEGMRQKRGEELISFLVAYDYEGTDRVPAPTGAGDLGRWANAVEEGTELGGPETFDTVMRAWHRGELDDATYFAVLERRQALAG